MLRGEVTPNQTLLELTRSVLGSCEIGLTRNGLLEEGMYGLGLRDQKCSDAVIQAIPHKEDTVKGDYFLGAMTQKMDMWL